MQNPNHLSRLEQPPVQALNHRNRVELPPMQAPNLLNRVKLPLMEETLKHLSSVPIKNLQSQ